MVLMRQFSSFLIALGAHGVIFLAEVGGGSLAPSADARQEITLTAAEFIEIDGSALLAGEPDGGGGPEPEPTREPSPPAEEPVKKQPPRRAQPVSNQRAPIKEVAAQPEPRVEQSIEPVAEALDLTSFRIAASAKASAAEGASSTSGSAAAEGSGTSAKGSGAGGSHGARGRGGRRGYGGESAEGNLSAQLAIANRRWRCPWPAAADRLAIHRESATIRVCVKADGALDSAEIRHDPGHGFGAAALSCAEQAKFTPARDLSGAPLDACATIRVRFER